MHVLVIGAAGMIGQKLVERIISNGVIGGRRVTRLTLHDVTRFPGEKLKPGNPPVPQFNVLEGDISSPEVAKHLVADAPGLIFHLAAIVSGEAETDFEKGYRINLDGMRFLLEAIRARGHKPKVVFTSSIAVFGAPFPNAIPDEFHLTPLTSYGTQKAIGELLLADYTRRGFLEGVGIRLPSIVVRPGKPNKAASGFFSNIIREPLAGHEAVLPVPDTVLHTHASPRAAIGFLLHGAELSREKIGPRVGITMPGVCCTVAEQIEALRRVAGDKVVARIRRATDPLVAKIVEGWPSRFDARRGLALGFRPERTFEEIIRIHIEDELGGKIA